MQPASLRQFSRREALRLATLAAAGTAAGQWLPVGASPELSSPLGLAPTADEALQRLMEGNRRWVAGRLSRPNQSGERRTEVAAGQEPFAIVFSCIDSRVPPELVFDVGLGDIFAVRTAGHVIDAAAMGSIEYGVEVEHVPLIVVLGHSRCGAIVASIDAVAQNATAPGSIAALVDGIRPAIGEAAGRGDAVGDAVDAVVRTQTVLTVQALKSAGPILSRAVAEGKLSIVGARYDLPTGMVELIA